MLDGVRTPPSPRGQWWATLDIESSKQRSGSYQRYAQNYNITTITDAVTIFCLLLRDQELSESLIAAAKKSAAHIFLEIDT
jgi:hypothetical protein